MILTTQQLKQNPTTQQLKLMINQRFPAWLPDRSMTIKQAARKNIVEFTRIRDAAPPETKALLDDERAILSCTL